MALNQIGNKRLTIRCLTAAAVTWIPLLVLTLMEGQAFGDESVRTLAKDLSVEGQYLLSLPLLMVAGTFAEARSKAIIEYLSESDMILGTELSRYQAAASDTDRWHNAPLAKTCAAILAVAGSVLMLKALVGGGGESWYSDGTGQYSGITPAGWWHIVVGLTVFHIVVLRRLWQFICWSVFLARLTRLNIQLVPSHPDRCGGIGILEMGQTPLALICSGAASILSASLAESMIAGTMTAQASLPYIFVFIIMCVIICLGPVLGFVPMLVEAKRTGLVNYGDIGESLFRTFDKKWTGLDNEKQSELIGDTDASSLADFGYVYEYVASMRTLVLSSNGFRAIIMGALVPFLPLVFIFRSVTDIVERLLGIRV